MLLVCYNSLISLLEAVRFIRKHSFKAFIMENLPPLIREWVVKRMEKRRVQKTRVEKVSNRGRVEFLKE